MEMETETKPKSKMGNYNRQNSKIHNQNNIKAMELFAFSQFAQSIPDVSIVIEECQRRVDTKIHMDEHVKK